VNPDLLVAALTVAVPMWVEVVRGLPFEVRQERAQRCMAEVAEHGDHILYRSKKKGESAKAFNALAEGLAILSLQPRGVTAFGMHWETWGGYCPRPAIHERPLPRER
jgi:uncharacterized protein YqjF (DUF2071 family)